MGTFLLTDKLLNIDYWNDYGNEFLLHRGKNVPEKEAQILFNRVNMIRAGVVNHPSMWQFCGYNEIREKSSNLSIPLYVANGNHAEKTGEENSQTLVEAIAAWQESSVALRKSMGTLFKTLNDSTLG